MKIITPARARANADLIAHAPADLAALVAVVREVEALHERVAAAPFESLTRDSVERSLRAALSKLRAAADGR